MELGTRFRSSSEPTRTAAPGSLPNSSIYHRRTPAVTQRAAVHFSACGLPRGMITMASDEASTSLQKKGPGAKTLTQEALWVFEFASSKFELVLPQPERVYMSHLISERTCVITGSYTLHPLHRILMARPPATVYLRQRRNLGRDGQGLFINGIFGPFQSFLSLVVSKGNETLMLLSKLNVEAESFTS